MPIAKIQLPDGRIARLEVPEGASEQDVMSFVQSQLAAPGAGQPDMDALLKKERTAWDTLTRDEMKQLVAARKAGTIPKVNEATPAEAAELALSGMSGAGKFAAGMGKGITDIARGAGQLVGLVSRDDIDESNKYDKPLTDTGAGLAGDITGKVAAAVPAMFIPGAGTLAGAGAIGAGIGALDPVGTDDSRIKNILLGLAGGTGGQLAGRGIAAGLKGAKALVEPFYKGGQENIAARTLQSFAGNADDAARNMATAAELVPGSVPTAAEAAKDAGIAQLQRSLVNQNPKLAAEMAERALDQNSARQAALHELTKYGSALDDAMARRAEAGAKLYENAFGQQIKVDEAIKTLTSRPSFKQALERAQRIAEEEGAPIKNLFDQNGKFASTRALHYVKMGFDDLINDAPKSGIGATELRAIKGTRGHLLDWMSENNPAYKTARVRFEKMSRPINREEVAREITSKATRSQLPNVRGENTFYPDAFARAIKDDGASVVRAVTGRVGKGLDDVMTPKQMATLGDVRNDLARTVAARDMGRAVGSNTAQNLASQNLLRQILGPTGLPQSWAESTLLQTAMRPAQFIAKSGEEGIQDVLAKAMLDPRMAAQLMQRVQQDPQLAQLARVLAHGATTGGALSANAGQ